MLRIPLACLRASLLLTAAGCGVNLHALAGGGGGYSGGGGFSGGGSGGFSGGGGGFSGGYSGGYSSGGGSGGDAPGWLIIAIVVIVIVIKIASAASRTQRRRVVQRGRRARHLNRSAAIAQRLREVDPAFDLEAFGRRAREGFLKAQRAWSAQDLTSIRPFISDGIAARWGVQLAEQQRLDVRDQVEHVTIDEVELVALHRGDGVEVLDVFITGTAVDRKLRRSTGKALGPGLNLPAQFAEYWSFLRRSGSPSLSGKPGLIEGRCPNCGAPVAANQHAKCAHCGIALRSGEHDWVLAEITQPSEWVDEPERRVAGREDFRDRDPGFSIQALEDRASVLFYRWRAAESWGDAQRLRGFATDDCIAWAAGEIGDTINRAGVRHWIGEVAVGSVRTEAVQHGDRRDRALVEVRWSGLRSSDAHGELQRGHPTPPRRSYLLLERPADATSDVDAVLSGGHCPSCGAPDEDLADGTCRACGQVQADGGAWLLAEVHPWSAREVAELKRSVGAPRPSAASILSGAQDEAGTDGTALVAWVAAMALADGRVDERETVLLREVCAQCGVAPQQLPSLLEEAKDRGHSELPQPVDVAAAGRWFEQLVDLAAADGVVDAAEKRLLVRVGRHAGHEPSEVRRRIRGAERDALRAARADLRAATGTRF